MNNLFSFFSIKYTFPILLFKLFTVYAFSETNHFYNDSLKYEKQFYNLRNTLTSLVFIDPDSALICAKDVIKRSNDKEILGLCFHTQGVISANRGDFKKSLEYNFIAQKLFSDLKDEHYINILNLNIGFCYTKLSYYTLATNYLFKARNYFDKTDETVVKNRIYLVLTELFIALKEHRKAKDYAFSSSQFSIEAKDTFGLSTSYNDIALVYYSDHNYKKAKNYYLKALKLSTLAKLNRSLSYAQHGLGEVFLTTKQLDSASFYFKKVLKNKEADEVTRIKCLRNIAKLAIHKKDFQKAEKTAKEALSISKKNKILLLSYENYKFLGELYAIKKDFEKAYLFKDSSILVSDSIYQEKKIKQAAEFEEIYQNKKKQEQIEALAITNKLQKAEYQKTQNFAIGLTVSLLLVIIAGVFIIRFTKLKSAYENSELQQKLLRSQMNPHFIFNAISSIQSFIIKNNADEAGLYLSKFAKLMRHILLNSKQEFILLEDEIDTLENYLKLQQLRLNNCFEYKISISEEIEEDELVVPPMIIQPFVENAIKHGFNKVENGGLLLLNISSNNTKLQFEITDNGVGRLNAGIQKEKGHQSLATEITSERLKHLGKKFRNNTEIKIVDLYDKNIAQGTKVIVKLPLKYID